MACSVYFYGLTRVTTYLTWWKVKWYLFVYRSNTPNEINIEWKRERKRKNDSSKVAVSMCFDSCHLVARLHNANDVYEQSSCFFLFLSRPRCGYFFFLKRAECARGKQLMQSFASNYGLLTPHLNVTPMPIGFFFHSHHFLVWILAIYQSMPSLAPSHLNPFFFLVFVLREEHRVKIALIEPDHDVSNVERVDCNTYWLEKSNWIIDKPIMSPLRGIFFCLFNSFFFYFDLDWYFQLIRCIFATFFC